MKAAFQLLDRFQKADSVIPITNSVSQSGVPLKWKIVKFLITGLSLRRKRSQDLPPAFHDCGQFYFFKCDEFLKTGKLVTDNTIGLEVPESEVQDIDNEEDWKIAEMKYDLLRKNNGT